MDIETHEIQVGMHFNSVWLAALSTVWFALVFRVYLTNKF